MIPEYEALLAEAGRVAPYHGNARLVEALAAAVRDLDTRAEAAEAEVRRYEDFSNEVVAMAGDEWDGDDAQETIAIRYVRHIEAALAAERAAPEGTPDGE